MSTAVVVGGLTYNVPAVGESNWGQNVSDLLIAVAANISGSAFFTVVAVSSSPITVVSGRTYLVDTGAGRQLNLPTPAANAYLIVRDTTGQASSNNITIHRAAGEKIDGVAADKTLSTDNGQWWIVSDGTDWFTLLNAPINSGLGLIVNADINASAAIAVSKLAALTASRAVVTNGSGVIAPSAVTATEVGYLSGVTSQVCEKSAVINQALTGFSAAAGIVAATDTILQAMNKLAPNRIMQAVVLGTTTTGTNSTSSAWVGTALSAKITPKSTSSKILVVSIGSFRTADTALTPALATIYRDAVDLSGGPGFAKTSIGGASLNTEQTLPMIYLDSPSSTSELTYKVYISNSDNTTTVSHNFGAQVAVMLLIEIL